VCVSLFCVVLSTGVLDVMWRDARCRLLFFVCGLVVVYPFVLPYALLPVFRMRTRYYIHVVFVLISIFLPYCIFVCIGFSSVAFRYVCCMLVLALLSYVPVQIHVDYPECVEHIQIWGHCSLYILYVLYSACEGLWMSVLRTRNYMFGTIIHKCRCLTSCLVVLVTC
jgi:hypothetical protein